MKKLSIISLLVLSLNALAQESSQKSGNYSLDLNLNPASLFDAAAGSMFTMPNIHARYFMSSDIAFRVRFDMDYSKNFSYTDTTNTDYNSSSSLSLLLAPGIEKHFTFDKVSVYLGGEIPITNFTSRSKNKRGDNITTSKNTNGGYIGYGINAVFGVDYYVLTNLYIGAEFTPGFLIRRGKDQRRNESTISIGAKDTSFHLGSSSGLRLGIRF